ncbi:hypothetical protein ACM66B_001805 [Microbotryomycetes sp. NB124-2]
MTTTTQDVSRASLDSATTSTSALTSNRVLGTMVVLVMRAKNLQNRVKLGKQNPYATVTFGLNKKRTAAIERGGQQPTWDAEFRFEIMKDPLDQLRDDAQAVVDKRGGVMPLSSAGTPTKVKDAASQTTAATVAVASSTAAGASLGKRILRIAVYADDPRDPRLVGEGTLDLEDVIKKGTFDGWVSLERKSRYAGEVKLELTWYWNEPPKGKTRSKSPAPNAYGGPGSRTADLDEEETSRAQAWDSSSDVGSAVSAGAPVDLGPDYPDPDLAPLSHSMSTMGLNSSQRGPLPVPPLQSASRQPQHHAYANAYSSVNGAYMNRPPTNTHDLGRRASYAAPGVTTYQTAGYGQFGTDWRGEFGEHDGAAHQMTIGASTRGHAGNAYEENYPAAGYLAETSQAGYASPFPSQYATGYSEQRFAPPPQFNGISGHHRHAPLPQPPLARPSAANALSHSQSMSSLQGVPAPPTAPPSMHAIPAPPSTFFPPPPAMHPYDPVGNPAGFTAPPQPPMPPASPFTAAGHQQYVDPGSMLPRAPPQPPVPPPSMRRPPSVGALPLRPQPPVSVTGANSVNGLYHAPPPPPPSIQHDPSSVPYQVHPAAAHQYSFNYPASTGSR